MARHVREIHHIDAGCGPVIRELRILGELLEWVVCSWYEQGERDEQLRPWVAAS